jgi:signal transduction histidine kinase
MTRLIVLLSVMVGTLSGEAQDSPGSRQSDFPPASPSHFLTNAVQFRDLSANDYLNECAFQLTGVVTLVDSNRSLVVLQDATGAVAVNFDLPVGPLRIGQLISLDGTNCYPYVVSFPKYPFHPSGSEIRKSFDAPVDFGEYYLTRMRGYLRPRTTGEYTFWIASDNSSELWLSPSDDPSQVKKIAFVSRYSWVNRQEWSHYPSQRSEPVLLEGGRWYYIEALHEQTTYANHLSVAWQGPGLKQEIIDNRYLVPYLKDHGQGSLAATNGILREYWTNYSAGNLSLFFSALRSFESTLSAEKVRVNILGQGELPKAGAITLNQQLPAQDNFRWVEAEGQVRFAGTDGEMAYLELSDGQAQVQVHLSHWNPELSPLIRNSRVRVEGVCEGVYDRNGILVPGLIWASAENGIKLIGPEQTSLSPITSDQRPQAAFSSTNATMTGFYGTRGVVTFNDRVFGKDYLFVQEEAASVFVSLQDRHFENQLKVGQGVDLGGALQPGRTVPVISPLVVTELGWRSMPAPIPQPVRFPVPESSDGRWTEIEGVVHSVNSNGTLTVMGKPGPICLWLGQTPSNQLSRLVDAKLRARGVLSLAAAVAPLVLIPSRGFVDVEETGPENPFAIPSRPIANLAPDTADPSSLHRARLAGEVTFRDAQSFFVQDRSGGIRVQCAGSPNLKVGDSVEVAGFPAMNGSMRIVTEALVRSAGKLQQLQPQQLDLSEARSLKQGGMLVQVSAIVLAQKLAGVSQVLELQEQQRIFAATLSIDQGRLPVIAPGSRLSIKGVCDNETIVLPGPAGVAFQNPSAGSPNLWLRSPSDVIVLRGPPWWTLKRAVTLVGTLLTILLAALLWVHLLRRRLERQHAARLAFSRQILQSQESERQRIAANLHDSLGQNLLVIKNQARLAMQPVTDETLRQQRLNEISEITSQAIEEVRQITHDLRPYQLDRLGLTQAIRASVNRASENSSILFASHVDEIDTIFDKESEIHIYRVVQEAVNNVVKHSAGTEAAVVVKNQPALVSLSVRDNGCGFDAGAVGSSRSADLRYGLSGITERVRILGGTLVVDSRPAQGTSLMIEIPKPDSHA